MPNGISTDKQGRSGQLGGYKTLRPLPHFSSPDCFPPTSTGAAIPIQMCEPFLRELRWLVTLQDIIGSPRGFASPLTIAAR